MYWKKLEDSSLHIDFGLILTNLPCSDAEVLLIPDGCFILIHHVLGCQDQTWRICLRELCIVFYCILSTCLLSAFYPVHCTLSIVIPSGCNHEDSLC